MDYKIRGHKNRHVAVALTVFLLSACQSATPEVTRPFDLEVARYHGQVIPFIVPYTLRYNAGPAVRQRVAFEKSVDGNTTRGYATWQAKVSVVGEDRVWKLDLYEFAYDNHFWQASSTLLEVTGKLSSPTGGFDTVDVDSTGFRQQAAGSSEQAAPTYQSFAEALSGLAIPLPIAPVSMYGANDPSSGWLPKIIQLHENFAPAVSEIQANTISERVVGASFYKGVHTIVFVMDGRVEAKRGSSSAALEIVGHVLIDSRTGLVRRAALASKLMTNESGRNRTGTILFKLEPY